MLNKFYQKIRGFKSPYIALIGSYCNVGKTTIMCILASKFLRDNKKVFFITDEPERFILRKIGNLVDKEKILPEQFIVKRIVFKEKFFEVLSKIEADYIFIDIGENFTDSEIELLRNFGIQKNISTFVTYQLKKTFLIDGYEGYIKDIKIKQMFIVDLVFIIEKYTISSFFEKLKSFFFASPNILITSIKNRFGKPIKVLETINFKKVNQ